MSVQRRKNNCSCCEESSNGDEAFLKVKSTLKRGTDSVNPYIYDAVHESASALKRSETWDKLQNNKYIDDYTIEQLQKEAEMELEKALKILKATEHVLDPSKSPKDTMSEPSIQFENDYRCTSFEQIDSNIPTKLQFACLGSESSESVLIPNKSQKPSKKDVPQKPKLTCKQIDQLLEAERRDVDLALHFSLDIEEIYKKPCPKQQKAKQNIKQLADLRKKANDDFGAKVHTWEMLEPDPEDISPDTMAAIIFSQEKGVIFDSSPDFTVRHLFPDHSKRKRSSEDIKSDLDFMLSPDDECSKKDTVKEIELPVVSGKKYSLEEGGEFYVGAPDDSQFQAESRYKNKVQLRGSLPPWFPGYLAALTDKGDKTIQSIKFPENVFQRAWMSVKPSNIPSTDIFIMK